MARDKRASKRFQPLVQTAHRALDCDALIVVADDGDFESAGLLPLEIESLQGKHGVLLEKCLDRDFTNVVKAPAIADDITLGMLYALQRSSEPLTREYLAGQFAAQLGLALALESPTATSPDHSDACNAVEDLLVDSIELAERSPAELVHELSYVLRPYFPNTQIGVLVAEDESRTLRLIHGGLGEPDEVTSSLRIGRFDTESIGAVVLTTGLPLITSPGQQQSGHPFNYEYVMSVPLRNVGVIQIASSTRPFNVEDAALAQAIAPRLANAVKLASRFSVVQRQRQLAETQAEVALAIASGQSMETFLPRAFEAFLEICDANMLAIVPVDGEPLSCHRDVRSEAHEAAVLTEARDVQGIRAYVYSDSESESNGTAVFYVPVVVGEQQLGTLAALRLGNESFTPDERESLTLLVNFAGVGLVSDRYYRQQAELARLHERQKIADDLHDDVAQIFVAAQFSLDRVLVDNKLDKETARRVARARGLVVRGATTIRNVIHRLSQPSQSTDLINMIESTIRETESEFDLEAELSIDPAVVALGRRLSADACDAATHVVRESLVNVAKHAGPCVTKVSLDVPEPDMIRTIIVDSGQGLTKSSSSTGHGLVAIQSLLQQYGGGLELSSTPEGGTQVVAILPASRRSQIEPADTALDAASP